MVKNICFDFLMKSLNSALSRTFLNTKKLPINTEKLYYWSGSHKITKGPTERKTGTRKQHTQDKTLYDKLLSSFLFM